MNNQQQNQGQHQQPYNEHDRIRMRKQDVVAFLQKKYQDPLWNERLMKICGGDESLILRHMNSFIAYIVNDDGGGNAKKGPKKYIADCSVTSISTCFLESIQMGLEVGGNRDHAYLINYANECELEISYKGFVYFLARHFDNVYIETECVFEGDDFQVSTTDSTATYNHKRGNPFGRSWEKLQGTYCYFSYTLRENGEKVSKIALIQKAGNDGLEMIRSKADGSFAWKDFPLEQAKKATIRRASKVPVAMIDFADMEVTPDSVDNRMYALEGRGPTSSRIERLVERQTQIAEELTGGGKEGAPQQEAPTPAEEPAQKEAGAAEAAQGQDDESEAIDAKFEDISDAEFEEDSRVIKSTVEAAWDYKTICLPDGKTQIKEFEDAAGGINYLLAIMKNRRSKASRLALISGNDLLIAAAVREGQGTLVNDLHKLASEGKDS